MGALGGVLEEARAPQGAVFESCRGVVLQKKNEERQRSCFEAPCPVELAQTPWTPTLRPHADPALPPLLELLPAEGAEERRSAF